MDNKIQIVEIYIPGDNENITNVKIHSTILGFIRYTETLNG